MSSKTDLFSGLIRESAYVRPVLSVPVSSSGCLQKSSSESREGLLQGTPYALDSHEIEIYRPLKASDDDSLVGRNTNGLLR